MSGFKVGDTVTLRGQNRKLAVISVSGIPGRELILQEISGIAVGCTLSRCLNGRFNDWQDGPEDIVPIPPDPLEWNPDWGNMLTHASMDANFKWFAYTKKPELNQVEWYQVAPFFVEIPKHLAPTFTGDWRQSLIERPQP